MDSLIQSLPEEIRKHIEGKEYTIDDMGKSGSKILIFDDLVLKRCSLDDALARRQAPCTQGHIIRRR